MVWGGFRVAKRAKVFNVTETKNSIVAEHDGYLKYDIIHKRAFNWNRKKIIINDILSKSTLDNAKVFFHFHSSVEKPNIIQNKVIFKEIGIEMQFFGKCNIEISKYELCCGFNRTTNAFKLMVTFDRILKTEIIL